jgi:REP element-mobilizing transposase RayT
MANTFTQLYIQTVFAVKGRHNLIKPNIKEELFKYITGIIQHRNHKLIAINGMPDHIHIFIGYHPTQSLSDLVRDIKSASSGFINDRRLIPEKFQWQEGYGAFTYSKSHIDNVTRYINNQDNHHKKQSFKMEYLDFLQKFSIEYDEKYLFEWIE